MKEKIRLVQIVKAYDDFSINVDFEVHEGEFVSLLGPSGSGKTTTLHVIAGFIAPDSGIILKDEKNITETPSEKRNIGIVFQDFALFPFLTVYSNIAFGLELKRLSRKEVAAEVDKFADSFGISSILHKYPDSISGGEKQRVALARAMITKPGILLMDEPLSSLDAKISERLRDELKDFHRKFGITIIYVTHDQVEAMYLSDRIILMNGGHIEQIGTPTEIYYSPLTSFAREFVGKINFIKFNDKTFFVRPEDIKIDMREGDIEGQIIDIHYLGSTTEIVINSQKGTLFALDLARNVTNFKKGDIIFLSFKQYGSS